MFKYLSSALVNLAAATLTRDEGVTDHHEQHHRLRESIEPFADKRTIHLVHHTHDDVGWLKTVDEYFSGIDDYI